MKLKESEFSFRTQSGTVLNKKGWKYLEGG
jgi:hypothetical protein